MYASPVLDISGRSWLRLWVSSADRDAIIKPLDPPTDKLFLPHKKVSTIFAEEQKVPGCRRKPARTKEPSHLVERSSQHKKAN